MKNILFGWVGKKIFELTLFDYFIFVIEFELIILLITLLIAFIVCKIDDIKFKKK